MANKKYAVKVGKKVVAIYDGPQAESDANQAGPTYGEKFTVEEYTEEENGDGGKTTSASKTETTTSKTEDPTVVPGAGRK